MNTNNYNSWNISIKKISEAIITVSHIAILNDNRCCLKLLAANIIAIRQQAIEIYIISLKSRITEGKWSVNSETFCAGVMYCMNTFIHNPKIYNAGSKKTIAKIAVIFLGTLWVDVMCIIFSLNVINFYNSNGLKISIPSYCSPKTISCD